MENLREHSSTGVMERAAQSGEPLILGMTSGKQQKVIIKSATPYDFELEDGPRAKREVLYAFPPKTAKKLKQDLRRDPEIAALQLFPALRSKDRLWISKMILQRLIDESQRVRFTLLDGSIIPCRVRSFGLWELNVDVKGGELAIFRHGVYRLHLGTEVLVDHAVEGFPHVRLGEEPLFLPPVAPAVAE